MKNSPRVIENCVKSRYLEYSMSYFSVKRIVKKSNKSKE